MKDVLPHLVFIVYFDYYSRHVNLVITILGIIFNIFHFSILVRKPLRYSPVYIIMLVICICDLAQLFVLIPDDLQYIIEFNHPDVCLGFLTYPSAIYTIVADVISRFASFVSTWMAVVMAVFRSVAIKFVMSSWSDKLSNTSTAYTMLTIVTVIATIYISICSYLKFKIMPSLPQLYCLYTNRTPSQQLYIVYGTDDELSALYFFTMVEGYIQVAQLLLFAFSTCFLANSIKETKKKRALMNKNDQKNERTEGLILFMLGSFFLAIFPMMFANFTLEYFVSMLSPYVLKASITSMYILQTLNASSHGIICFFLSSEYQQVVKKTYFPKKNLSVAPAQNLTQHNSVFSELTQRLKFCAPYSSLVIYQKMHNQNSKPQSPHPMKVLIYFLIWILVIYTVLLLIKDQEPNTEWTSPQFPRPPNEYDTRPPSESPQPPNPSTEITEIVCKSPECITLAHHLHNWQDISVDPCQDFYQATCGKYNEPRKSQKTRFGHMTGIMYNLVTEHLNKNEPNTSKLEKAMRVYYDKCEESSEQTADEENAERMRELFQTVQKIGSWPMADSHWNEDDFNLNNMISNMASLGKTNFGVFSVKPTKDSHIEVSLDRELTKELDENKLNKFIGDILTTNNIKINQDIMKSDMEDIEELIHHILMPHHFSSKSSAPLSKLQKNVRAIDFERILKTFVNPSKKEMLWSKIADRVVVKNQGYFFDGTKNVKTILKTTTTRTLANFLIYNFLRSEFKKHELEDKSNCAQTLLNTFPISALRIFARSRFDKKKLKGASEMAEEIRDSLIEIIQKSTWLHEKTKMKAIQKVKKMNMRVGYLKELEISGELDLFYDSIIASSTDSSFPEFEKISEKFEIEQSMDFVASHLPILSNNDYFEEHAFYQSSKNRLVVNVPFIDDPFFDPTYLKYAKIANFGEVIAHEMGHSFDSKGRKRDENGEKNNWWTSEDSSEYEKRSQCLLDQYNENYGTGNSTKSSKINEMITDMIGVAVAWNAYNKLDLTNEPKIIGFEDYHMDKMFFRLTASNWCGAESKAFDVNGVFSNMKSFAKAFHCPVGSPMNPEKKCELF